MFLGRLRMLRIILINGKFYYFSTQGRLDSFDASILSAIYGLGYLALMMNFGIIAQVVNLRISLKLRIGNLCKFSKYSTLKTHTAVAAARELSVNPEEVERNARERNVKVDVPLIMQLYQKRTTLTNEINSLNRERKSTSADGRLIRQKLSVLESERTEVESALEEAVLAIPNWSSPESPASVEGNRVIYQSDIENIPPSLDHCDWNQKYKLIDFEGAASVCGAHFYALKRTMALLELALNSWAVAKAVQKGFSPLAVPDVINEGFIYASGFQPRSDRQSSPVFRIADSSLALAGTSEIFLASQHANQIISNQLPLKYVAWSHCFRSEVGHHSALSRGLYRVHQFSKVELFTLTTPSQSTAMFDEITALQAEMLRELGLPFRILEMHRGELGSSASRKWDHEVWMPGRLKIFH